MSNCYEMKQEDLLCLLALQRAKGIGDVNAKKLIAAYGDAKNIFNENPRALHKDNPFKKPIQQVQVSANLKAAEEELHYISENKIETHYFLDKGYPEKLKHCVDAPILLFEK